MVQTKDMTSGNPVRLILIFALPILAGNMLQQLYSLVDSLIIGRLLGVTALTAVSASGFFMRNSNSLLQFEEVIE